MVQLISNKNMNTNINELNENINDNEDYSEIDIAILSTDLTIDDTVRKAAIQKFCSENPNDALEAINKLVGIYIFSRIKMLEKFIYDLCVNSTIQNNYKLILASGLCTSGLDIGYDAMNYICLNWGNDIPTPIKVESIFTLMEAEKYRGNALEYFISVINNQVIECDYRYKTILALEIREINNKDYFIKEACLAFLFNTQNMTKYRILSGQYLLQKCKEIDNQRVEQVLLDFALDIELDYNIRADSADVILRLGTDNNKKIARKVINDLGTSNSENKTIYGNSQNVHTGEIEKSVIDTLEFLHKQQQSNVNKYTFEGIKKEIDDLLKLEENKKNAEKIHIALNRIYMDRALYSTYNCTLMSIFIRIWSYIQLSNHKTEMIKRLLEELTETADTCSSGYISRLINCISGFDDENIGIRISWEDQIIANFIGRFNSRLERLYDEWSEGGKKNAMILSLITAKNQKLNINRIIKSNEPEKMIEYFLTKNTLEDCLDMFQEEILNDMSTDKPAVQKTCYLTFFRYTLADLRDELYNEFKEHITDGEFDIYMQKSVLKYETGEYFV